MKHNLVIKVLLVAIVILLAVNLITPLVLSSVTYAARRVEYKVIRGPKSPYDEAPQVIQSFLNKQAKEGWELVMIDQGWGCYIFKK